MTSSITCVSMELSYALLYLRPFYLYPNPEAREGSDVGLVLQAQNF